jgi:hypothetical protein
MRSYARVAPQFWTGATGRALRAAGRDAQVVALYLISCPAGLMTGVFYLPLPSLCHEVGISTKKARAALKRIKRARFALYDEASETVWVPEMARFQVGATLDATDKRIKGFVRELEGVRGSPFVQEFYEKYRIAFHLPSEGPWKGYRSPSGGPSKAPRSHAHAHAQAQEHAREGDGGRAPLPTAGPRPAPENEDEQAEQYRRLQDEAERKCRTS